MEAPGPGLSRPRSLLPARYSDPELWGEVRVVKPGKDNVIDFQLQ
jgi:hypothetical protein